MSALLHLISTVYVPLRLALLRGSGGLPPLTGLQNVTKRGYLVLSAGNAVGGAVNGRIAGLSTGSTTFKFTGGVITAPTSQRHQHSLAEDIPSDIDHAPILASYPEWIRPQDTLPRRHIGPSDPEIQTMLSELRQPSLDAFIKQTIPDAIRASKPFSIPSEQTPETEMLDELTKAGKANSAAEVDTYIGM